MSQTNILHLRPFWTKTFVQVPKSKRNTLRNAGQPLIRAEQGNVIGYPGIHSKRCVEAPLWPARRWVGTVYEQTQ